MKRFVPCPEQGQGLVEYGLILMLVALVVIGGLSLFGGGVSVLFSAISSSV